ncbi:alpha/beta hydrolase [Jidongwangia harbinensis]|uniref:alpha/beta hydrolase n=1 Tax=Jidongwangia harbinensis TaxID=2878561 RepID=UPI001CDA46AF|nr:alpha/beta hydrolase [Jidongwangia harbinensis]MCA2216434.1 alpha/beta hydrolase [Jidongwangia harbinensis]
MKRRTKAGLFATATAALCATVVPLAVANTGPEPGDVPVGLAEFYAQRPAWGPCPRPSWPGRPDAPPPPAARAGDGSPAVECTTVRVPLDYRRPDGPRETVALSRRAAADPEKRLGVLVEVPGGPGGQGIGAAEDRAYDALSVRYDIIGYDPRGVGPAQPLLCEGVNVQLAGRTRFTDAQMRAYAEEFRKRDQQCERADGARRPYFTSANNARDLDIVRAVLGERRLNLIGKSYGTYVTAVYGTLFPQRLNRTVLDSAMHPRWMWREAWKQQAITQRRTADAWMTWVAQRHETYGLGDTRAEVHATVEQIRAKLEEHPIEREDFAYDGDEFDGVIGATNEVEYWDYFAETVRRLGNEVDQRSDLPGDLYRALALQQEIRADEPPTSNGVWEAVNCEAEWPTDLEEYYADMRYFSRHYPYGWGASAASPRECTFGSVERLEPLVKVRRGDYPTGMVVQEEFDPQTPYEGGRAMADLLGHRLLTVPRDGYHVVHGANPCVDAAIDDYLLNGTLPKRGATCAGTPIPDVPADASASGARDARPSLDEQTRTRRKHKMSW